MEAYKMGAIEETFAGLVWENEPIPSGKLVKLAAEHLEWKKSTTYTIIKKLCNKGILKSEGSIVSSVLSRDQYLAKQSKRFVDEAFQGSLPGFLTAFAREEELSAKDIAQIREVIDSLGK